MKFDETPTSDTDFRKESESEVKNEIQNWKFLIKNKDLLFPSVRNWCIRLSQ